MQQRLLSFLLILLLSVSCGQNYKQKKEEKHIPLIGFLDQLPDETLEQARKGFFVALKENGFDEKQHTIEIIYRNAQNDQPTLLQSCDYIISKKPDLIATNPTLPTVVTVQKTKDIPIFMMVSPRPDIAKLTDEKGNPPSNLFGTFETLEYIDTAVMLVKTLLPHTVKLGVIYNQSEPQSVDALKRIEEQCQHLSMQLEQLPVNNSNETQLVVQALLNKKIDVFFALPDNTVFSSMELIVKLCDEQKVPVFTSEEGLVKRGALVAFGADMYQWGYQSGMQAVQYLQSKSLQDLKPEIVKVRRRVFNSAKAKLFHINFDNTFVEVK